MDSTSTNDSLTHSTLSYSKLPVQPKFKECLFDSDKKPAYLRTWLRLLSGIVRNIPHGKPLELYLDNVLDRRLHEKSTRPAFLTEDIFRLTKPSEDDDDSCDQDEEEEEGPEHYYEIPELSQELDSALFHTLFTIVQGSYLDIITDLTGDYARYTFAVVAMWRHGELGSSTRRITAMTKMQELQYHGDAAKWKLEFLARAREIYSSKLTIEHFIMHCAFKSFEGKNTQVQSMIALDINSDKVGEDMSLEKVATKYSSFLSTLTAGKSTSKVNSAAVKCTFCKKPGHTAANCRARLSLGKGGGKGGGKGDGKGGSKGGGKGESARDKWKASRYCHHCGEKGHIKPECPKLKHSSNVENTHSTAPPSRPANAAQVSDDAINDLCKKLKSGEIKLALNVNESPSLASSNLAKGHSISPSIINMAKVSTPATYPKDAAIVLSACDGMGAWR